MNSVCRSLPIGDFLAETSHTLLDTNSIRDDDEEDDDYHDDDDDENDDDDDTFEDSDGYVSNSLKERRQMMMMIIISSDDQHKNLLSVYFAFHIIKTYMVKYFFIITQRVFRV